MLNKEGVDFKFNDENNRVYFNCTIFMGYGTMSTLIRFNLDLYRSDQNEIVIEFQRMGGDGMAYAPLERSLKELIQEITKQRSIREHALNIPLPPDDEIASYPPDRSFGDIDSDYKFFDPNDLPPVPSDDEDDDDDKADTLYPMIPAPYPPDLDRANYIDKYFGELDEVVVDDEKNPFGPICIRRDSDVLDIVVKETLDWRKYRNQGIELILSLTEGFCNHTKLITPQIIDILITRLQSEISNLRQERLEDNERILLIALIVFRLMSDPPDVRKLKQVREGFILGEQQGGIYFPSDLAQMAGEMLVATDESSYLGTLQELKIDDDMELPSLSEKERDSDNNKRTLYKLCGVRFINIFSELLPLLNSPPVLQGVAKALYALLKEAVKLKKEFRDTFRHISENFPTIPDDLVNEITEMIEDLQYGIILTAIVKLETSSVQRLRIIGRKLRPLFNELIKRYNY